MSSILEGKPLRFPLFVLLLARLAGLIGALQVERKPEEAEPYFDQCIRLRQSALPKNHQLVLISRLAMAQALVRAIPDLQAV